MADCAAYSRSFTLAMTSILAYSNEEFDQMLADNDEQRGTITKVSFKISL
jgi:hypothetical protein